MYAAEMVAHCGIQAWARNSRVVVASADSASAPFTFERELAGVFSHEPAATRAPTGEYVVYFTTTAFGCGKAVGACVPPDVCAGMGNGSTCNPGGPTCWAECDGLDGTPKPCHDNKTSEHSPRARFPTYMVHSKHPLGPFSPPVMVYNGSDIAGVDAPATGDTNLAAVIFEDGSLAGLWRGGGQSVNGTVGPFQYQFGVTAANWRDPETYDWGRAIPESNVFPAVAGNESANCGIEDPTLYLDSAGIVHAVVHNWRGGGHAASADKGKTWRWYGGNCSARAGSGSLDWTRSVWPETFRLGGEIQTPTRRERPHLVVGADGVVTALTTSVQLGLPDMTWTLVQTMA
jgi:hypothetical protein